MKLGARSSLPQYRQTIFSAFGLRAAVVRVAWPDFGLAGEGSLRGATLPFDKAAARPDDDSCSLVFANLVRSTFSLSPQPYRLGWDVCSVAAAKRAIWPELPRDLLRPIEAMRRRMEPEQLDWLRGPTRAMCVTARAGGGRSMNRKISVTSPSLCDEIAALKDAAFANLKDRWRSLYGTEPPRRISRELLTRAVAYRIQEQVRGGLKLSTRRLLTRLADDARSGRPLGSEPAAAASAGSVLVREWHGVTHEVRVLDRGVLYQRKRYRSLTEVAKLITGAHWNGPSFFGVRRRRKQDARYGSK